MCYVGIGKIHRDFAVSFITGFFLRSPAEFYTGSVLIELSHSLGWGW